MREAVHENGQNHGREAEMREAVHENGQNHGREAEMREAVHENGRNHGRETGIREAVHEIGQNHGREAEIREAIHENGRNRGWETGILSHECVFCGERAVGLKCISQEHFMGLYQSTSLFGRLCHLRRQDLIFSWFQSDREIHAGVSLSVVIIVPPWAGRTILNTLDCNILGFQSEIADHREPIVGILILDIQTFPREVVEIFILNPCS